MRSAASYRFLKLGDQVVFSPPRQVSTPKIAKRLPHALSVDEIEQVLSAADTPRNRVPEKRAFVRGPGGRSVGVHAGVRGVQLAPSTALRTGSEKIVEVLDDLQATAVVVEEAVVDQLLHIHGTQ
jgi:hypothetical protein